MYGNPDGTLKEGLLSNRKRYLCLVDGIIAGEGNGPMNPDPVKAGVILFGVNPVVVDAVGAVIMGFDINRIPAIRHGFNIKHYPLTGCAFDEIACISNQRKWYKKLTGFEPADVLNFKPHFGWVGHVEKAINHIS